MRLPLFICLFIHSFRQRSRLVPGHGVQVRYPLGTNVNTLFFQAYPRNSGTVPVPKCKVSILYSNTKVDTVSLWAAIFVSSGYSTALFSLLSSCFKTESDRAKWNDYVHSQSHIGHSKCERNTILCRYPGTGCRAPSVGSP